MSSKVYNKYWPLLAIAFLFYGCAATGGSRSASGTVVKTEDRLRAEQMVHDQNIPEELQPYYIDLYSQGKQNEVLHAMRAGLAALRMQRFDLAEKAFDLAILDVEALQEGAKQAERAKSKFVAEQEKWFKGESYERAALFFYRGLLYSRAGDHGNASACFRRCQIQDITGDDAKDFAGDWSSAEIALAQASYWNGIPSDADAALQRRKTFASLPSGNIFLPSDQSNLLVVIETGSAPLKYREGKQKEKLRFGERSGNVVAIRTEDLDGVKITTAAENLYTQATTRGTRQIDYVLKGKAEFKEDTANAAGGLAMGAVAASNVDRSGIATGILALASIGTMIASSATHSEADIRAWDNLPDNIFLLPLHVSPSQATIHLIPLAERGTELTPVDVPNPLLSGETKTAVVFIKL